MELPDNTRAKIEADLNTLDRWTFTPVNFIGDALKLGVATALRQVMNDFSLHLWDVAEKGYQISVRLGEGIWAEFSLEEVVLDESGECEDLQRLAAELRRLADLVDKKREALPPIRKRRWVYDDETTT